MTLNSSLVARSGRHSQVAHRACDLRDGFGCRAFGRHRRRKARTRARAWDGRASDGTRDTRRAFSNVIRCRASASSFLARRASNADGRRRARARDAGSRTRVRPLRARVARGDDTQPLSRPRPRLRNRPAPPQPARPNEKTSRAVPNRCLFPSSRTTGTTGNETETRGAVRRW